MTNDTETAGVGCLCGVLAASLAPLVLGLALVLGWWLHGESMARLALW